MPSSLWDARFSGDDYAYGTAPNDFLSAEASRIPPGRVLSLAEGEGRNATFLAGLGHAVTAVDYSAEGLKKAARLSAAQGLTLDLVQADSSTYALPRRTFAGIVSIFGHLPPAVRRRLHAEVVEALLPGGVFLLEAYRPAQLALGTGGPKDVSLLMSLDHLRDELRGLELVVAREVEREIREGKLHQGPSATVQVIGVRGA